VARAAARGVRVLAVTDHDTLEGLPAAIAAGEPLGVRVIPGVEISVRAPRGQFHLLADLPAPDAEPLATRLAELRRARLERVREILHRLEVLGAPVELPDVLRHASGTVGRPHVAQALVDAGHVVDRRQAFERYLADDRPAHVPHHSLEPADAIGMVRESGGAPVLAHPASLRMGLRELEAYVARLRHLGLVGIEVHRPEHTPQQRDGFRRIARRLALIACGGSDFHGSDHGGEVGDTGFPPLPADVPDRVLDAAGQRVPSSG
jgi:predicted metal-dependent phosphoesterase TrpH